ncbi:MAG TPA: methylmalonyl-CoA mutase family protein [Mycobacteriales bacterium]|jgi:methylmalonyl-CoA mutase N-terminal domain/subunit|nr:methylmalonyl-CoA mutase family protein [Mycobacteriales bacterium]
MDIRTESDIPVAESYGPGDVGAAPEPAGTFPFTRGVHHEMYRSRPWRMRQYAGYGTATETVERWQTLLREGQNGISCAFDLATQLGLDSDDPEATPEVGRLGVAVDTLADMEGLFAALPLDKIAATFNINAPSAIIYALFLATARQQGADLTRVSGTLSNDPLVEFIARGLWRVPPRAALRLFADTFESSLENTPNFYPINIRGCLFYEAGASDIQEMAFVLSCAKEYLRTLVARGMDVNVVGRRFSFMMFADHNLLEQAAKFRAARRMWAHICRDEFGATDPSAMKFRVTAPVGSYNFKIQQPELNIVRGAYGALAAVLGGCQAMLVAGYDEAYDIPTEHAALLALRTQQVLAEESGVTKAVDPLGGSYYVEALTDEMESRAAALIAEIDGLGGIVPAIEQGFPQRAIADTAFQTEQSIESGTKRVVGVNCYVMDEDRDNPVPLHQVDDTARTRQLAALAEHRRTRDPGPLAGGLAALETAARGEANLIEPVIRAAEAGATLGEMMDLLVAEFGEYRESFSA